VHRAVADPVHEVDRLTVDRRSLRQMPSWSRLDGWRERGARRLGARAGRIALPGAVLVGAALVFLAVLGPTAPALGSATIRPSGSNGFDPRAVDQFVNGYLRRTGLPGASVVVVHGSDVAHAAGYGHDSRGAPVTADTPMPIASLSKSVTATAVMRLVEADRVKLDLPVASYLPEFRMADPRAARITVRELLNQTSGMADSTFAAMRQPRPDSLRAAVAELRSARLATDPGTVWHYHNPNYQVAARLVEVVSGEPYADYLRRHIFGPLGMRSTFAAQTSHGFTAVAAGHIDAWGHAYAIAEPQWFNGGSGDVVTTANDLATWLVMQLTRGTAQRPGVVSATAIDLMHTGSDPTGRYGFGWGVSRLPDGEPRLAHDGALFTFTAYQLLLPASGYGVAVITNRGMTLGTNDAEAIGHGLADLIDGGPARLPAVPGLRLIDATLGSATVVTLALAGAGLRRARRRAILRRPMWRRLLSALPCLLPTVVLLCLPRIGGYLFDGRDVTLKQIGYISPATVTFLAITSAAALAIPITRAARTRKSAPAAHD
jgi:CubicO group peptidase (beta-lactamase class C family)